MTTPDPSTDGALSRQLPVPTPESQPFWDGCARHELLIQRCHACGQSWFPPANVCQHCWNPDFAWTEASGDGELFSFTVYRRAYSPELAGQLPYVVGIVELAEGPRLVTNIVGCGPEQLRVGMPVRVTFRDLAGGTSLHAFRPRAV
jgi:hypothetical protein